MHSPEDYILRFDPIRNANDYIIESATDYVHRIKDKELPNWPEDVLIEWLYRHNRHATKYTFLGFKNLQFTKIILPIESIPGREAFYNPTFFDDFVNIEQRAKETNDWLADYMLDNGTWNTPIVLLDNTQKNILFPDGQPLRSPVHLLEGHRRLSFLNGLKNIRAALPKHEVWKVSWETS